MVEVRAVEAGVVLAVDEGVVLVDEVLRGDPGIGDVTGEPIRSGSKEDVRTKSPCSSTWK